MKTFVMGKGTVVTGAGVYLGQPCISFADALTPGGVGEAVSNGSPENLNLQENGFCVVMPSLRAAERVLTMVKEAVEACERQVMEIGQTEDAMTDDAQPKPRFNHAFDINFEIHSNNEDANDVTGAMIRAHLLAKISSMSNEELRLEANCVDTMEAE